MYFAKQSHTREFLLRVSYMEIYNEEIKDLLAPENCKLQIHENFEVRLSERGNAFGVVLAQAIAAHICELTPTAVLEILAEGHICRRSSGRDCS
jgi:hypothetical protein